MRTIQFQTISILSASQRTWLYYNILLVVNDSIKLLGRHT